MKESINNYNIAVSRRQQTNTARPNHTLAALKVKDETCHFVN